MGAGLAIVFGLLWLAIAVASLIWGTAFFVRLFGEEQCLPRGSFGPWLFFSGALSVLLWWLLRSWGAASLTLVFGAPILVAALWSIRLRLAERTARRKEFGWVDDRLVRLADGAELAPTFAKSTGAYFNSGPASGYGRYCVELLNGEGSIARNAYVHAQAVRNDVDRLAHGDCKVLDAQVVWQASPTAFYSCHLNPWADLLCGQLHTLPEDSARFWRRWVRPHFSAEGSSEIPTAELRTHVAPLLDAAPNDGERLKTLLKMAGPSVRIMTEHARRALEDGIRGKKGRSILEFESGVAKVTIRPSP